MHPYIKYKVQLYKASNLAITTQIVNTKGLNFRKEKFN